jgi:hypothetical protein
VWPGGLCQEIEAATFRLSAHCLNQLRHRVPIDLDVESFKKFTTIKTICGLLK